MFDGILSYFRNNHLAQMALCCMLPVVLIFGLQFLGIGGVWVYPLAIFACLGSHVAMGYFGANEDDKGERKSCH